MSTPKFRAEVSPSTCNITVMEAVIENPVTRFSLACLQCQRSKRHCDRAYPKCGLCYQYVNPVLTVYMSTHTNKESPRRRLTCDYPHRRKERVSRSLHGSAASNASLNILTEGRRPRHHGLFASGVSDFFAIRFLDPHMFHQMRLEIPKVDAVVPRAVADLVGGVLDIQKRLISFSTLFIPGCQSYRRHDSQKTC